MANVKPFQVRLRKFNFETAKCKICRYFKDPFCNVLGIDVSPQQVCDAYQGDKNKFKPYKVSDEDIQAFIKGMVRTQPYKHFVVKGIETPIGPLVIIKDSMKPKAHYFSLDMKFHMLHTSQEHHWLQKEVDKLVRVGKRRI